MSNTSVGNVYLQIIEDVISTSRGDFEDGGVDESVLEELKLVRTREAVMTDYQLARFLFVSLHAKLTDRVPCFFVRKPNTLLKKTSI